MYRFIGLAVSLALAAAIAGCGRKEDPARPAEPGDDGSADVVRGEAAMAAREPKTAAGFFAAAAAKCATNLDARVRLAVARIETGEPDAALAAAESALELEPASAEALLVRGQALYLKKDYAKAAADFDAVSRAKGLAAALRSRALVARGVVYMAENRFDAARIAFLRAMRTDRRNSAAWYHMGILSRNTYHFPEAALEQFEMAARLAKDVHEAHTKKIARDIVPALRDMIRRAAADRPGVAKRDAKAAANLIAEAEALEAKKQMTAAMKKYRAAFEADPLSYPAARGYARLLARLDKTSAGVSKALDVYRAAIDQKPAAQINYLEAARLAYANGRWATAVRIMERAVAHDPENRASLDLLIAAMIKAGKTKEAEAWKGYRNEL